MTIPSEYQHESLSAPPYNLSGLGSTNVILGKNGSGKSRLMRRVDEELRQHPQAIGKILYITPERGGKLEYQPNVETNMINENWLLSTRRANQFGQFREQSASHFRRLELSLFREAERQGNVADVDAKFAVLSKLLDNVEMRREGNSFTTHVRHSGELIASGDLSSGESELISLAIECLVFRYERQPGAINYLLIDEPDVHLHPDLQERFVEFMQSTFDTDDIRLLITTHSTAMLSALARSRPTRVTFMKPGDTSLEFETVNETIKSIVPVFGAHPLSQVFNESPLLLVEGEDDARVWQQAIRTASGVMKLFPIVCDSLEGIARFEKIVEKIAPAIYDTPKAFSLRDGDETIGDLSDFKVVTRLRLACRATENLLLTDEVLDYAHLTWETTMTKIEEWIERNPTHKYLSVMSRFASTGFDRCQSDLKDLRNVIVGDIFQSNKPWEVLVGQVIGKVKLGEVSCEDCGGSLRSFLGPKTCTWLIGEGQE